MPFGPKNTPPFCTARMKILHDECVILFNSTKDIVLSNTSVAKIFWDSKTIIDETLIYSNHIPTLLHYFSCVAQVFTKYRLSFKMSKCDYFLPRIEYVGHDLTADDNCLVQSKFDLIKQWPFSPHNVFLLSFIGLCSFYNNYVSWFESNIKPPRRLQCLYHRQTLPLLAWSPQLIEVFNNYKTNLIILPLLLRYDSSKTSFFKTDWSTGDMWYILIQPENSPESVAAIKKK